MTAQHEVAGIGADVCLVNPKTILLYLISGSIHDRTTDSNEYELA